MELQHSSLVEQVVACVECKSCDSNFWHRNDGGEVVCDICYGQRRERLTRSATSQSTLLLNTAGQNNRSTEETRSTEGTTTNLPVKTGSSGSGVTRKSTRLKPSHKAKTWQNVLKPMSTKGRSRRIVFKKNPAKAPVSIATIVSSEYIFYRGSYWQIGDIVSAVDVDDGQTYYAQLRGFLEDQYCDKSAVITWLIPKSGCCPNIEDQKMEFDPACYTAGPEEDLPRDMAHFEFVCHASLDHFRHGSAHRSYAISGPPLGCIWTSLGAEIEPLASSASVDGSAGVDYDLQYSRNDGSQKSDRDIGKKLASLKEKTRSHKANLNRGKEKKQ